MEANVSFEPGAIDKIRSTLEEFARMTGKGIEEGVKEVGMSAGRQLAQKLQPYGLKQGPGEKFIKSIGRQVDITFLGVNLGAFPANTDIKEAHFAARFKGQRKGTVDHRLFRKEKGQKWLNLISQSEKEQHARKQQAKAGRAKGAWVQAVNEISQKKMSNVAKWISRHDSSSYGSTKKSGDGLGFKIDVENRTPYLKYIQPSEQVAKAMAFGYKNGLARVQKIIDAETKKANKVLS
jgi:hypothetical protein